MKKKRSQLIRLGNERLKRYSWEKQPRKQKRLTKKPYNHENNVKSYIYEWTNT